MKTQMEPLLRASALLALLSVTNLASAYYDPGVQRWISRDPIREPGFDLVRRHQRRASRGEPNRYIFVLNNPERWVDYDGLWHSGGRMDPAENGVQCDGHGGVEVHTQNDTASGVSASIRRCAQEHEERHARDGLEQQPGICAGAPRGTGINADTYEELAASERDAAQDEMSCLRRERCSNPSDAAQIEDRLREVRWGYSRWDKRHGGPIYRY